MASIDARRLGREDMPMIKDAASQPLHILLVDDEASIREPLCRYLENNQFRVTLAENAAAARRLLSAYSIDLVILDVMMPGEDGLSLCGHIRETHHVPIILLTAKADDADRIVGLEIGADDYITKPFNPRELLARARAVLRRANALPPTQRAPDTAAYAFGDWVLKTGERELVRPDGASVSLSTREFNLLMVFVQRPKIVLSREQLLDLIHRNEAAVFDRSIDNQVSRLRQKIEENPRAPRLIKTVWGGGYVFSGEVRKL